MVHSKKVERNLRTVMEQSLWGRYNITSAPNECILGQPRRHRNHGGITGHAGVVLQLGLGSLLPWAAQLFLTSHHLHSFLHSPCFPSALLFIFLLLSWPNSPRHLQLAGLLHLLSSSLHPLPFATPVMGSWEQALSTSWLTVPSCSIVRPGMDVNAALHYFLYKDTSLALRVIHHCPR